LKGFFWMKLRCCNSAELIFTLVNFRRSVYLGRMFDDFALVGFPRGLFYLGQNLDDLPCGISERDFALQGAGALEGSLQRVDTLEDSRLTVRLCGGRSSVAMGPQGSWGVGSSSRHQLPRTPCERYTRSPSTLSATPARNFPNLFGGAREFCTISHTKSFVGKDFPTNSPCEWFRC
jgi:hypothetical protein